MTPKGIPINARNPMMITASNSVLGKRAMISLETEAPVE